MSPIHAFSSGWEDQEIQWTDPKKVANRKHKPDSFSSSQGVQLKRYYKSIIWWVDSLQVAILKSIQHVFFLDFHWTTEIVKNLFGLANSMGLTTYMRSRVSEMVCLPYKTIFFFIFLSTIRHFELDALPNRGRGKFLRCPTVPREGWSPVLSF